MEILVLSQPQCGPCKSVKNHLKRLEIPFTEIDITKDADAIAKFGIMGTPVTILLEDGEELTRLVGFDPDTLEAFGDELD